MFYPLISSLVYHYCQKEFNKNSEIELSSPYNKECNFVCFEISEMNSVFKGVIYSCLLVINFLCLFFSRKSLYSMETQKRNLIIEKIIHFNLPVVSEAFRAIQNLSLFVLYSRAIHQKNAND